MKKILFSVVASFMMLGVGSASAQTDADNFYKSDLVNMEKVSFSNQYKMKVAGNLFLPKDMKAGETYPAIIVGHPMGAVKEQSANLYAIKMAEHGFVTLSIDLSFWGGSEGEPRNSVSPEIYAEDFSAAVDFLGTRPFVDRNRIGVIGICGSGSFAISAAKIDPRLKAIATISMYNMGTASRNGLKHALTLEQRKQIIAEAAEQRYVEFLGGETKYTGGTVHELTANSSPIEREFYEFYPRRCNVPDHHAPHPGKQHEVHELLSVCRYRNHLTAPHAFHHRRECTLTRIQRRRLQQGCRTQRIIHRARCRPCGPLRPGQPHPVQQAGLFL